jgi:hypothetical protein
MSHHSTKTLLRFRSLAAGLWLSAVITSAFAQAPLTTAPNVSNLLTQCSANTPVVGNGAGVAPKCHTTGALGSAAFANTGTSGATIGLLNAANTWSALQTFNSGMLAATAPAFTGTITGTYTLGGTPSVPTTALTGALQAAQEPAHTGQMTNSAGSLATVVNSVTGTATNDNATAGNVGEYKETIVLQASQVALTAATPATAVTLSLPAGDWDVSAIGIFNPAGTTTFNYVSISLSLTTNVLDTTSGRFVQNPYPAGFNAGGVNVALPVPSYRFSFSTTTSVFLVLQSNFATSTMGGYGILKARRMR